MDGAEFVAQLKRENERLLAKLDREPAVAAGGVWSIY